MSKEQEVDTRAERMAVLLANLPEYTEADINAAFKDPANSTEILQKCDAVFKANNM